MASTFLRLTLGFVKVLWKYIQKLYVNFLYVNYLYQENLI